MGWPLSMIGLMRVSRLWQLREREKWQVWTRTRDDEVVVVLHVASEFDGCRQLVRVAGSDANEERAGAAMRRRTLVGG